MLNFNITRSKNLAERSGDGITVSLDYDPVAQEIAVTVLSSSQEEFRLFPPNHLALQVFYHPFAFRDRYLQAGRFDHVAHSKAVA